MVSRVWELETTESPDGRGWVSPGTAASAGSARAADEAFRKAELRLRLLLLGDGALNPPLLRGELPRQRVTNEIKRLRAAFDELLEVERTSRGEVADAARALERELTEKATSHAEAQRARDRAPLLTPAEAAAVLGMSASSVYRAIRTGAITAATPPGEPIRVASTEVLRLLEARPRADDA
jgi:excisionase family DNA binding protein